mmetsp:Transcript_21142/g.27299  ORF Transcript_21142/g.27299 Transcript_21142/m.27299 type:complete len:392 (+) Transcript_21142:106-1281(+)
MFLLKFVFFNSFLASGAYGFLVPQRQRQHAFSSTTSIAAASENTNKKNIPSSADNDKDFLNEETFGGFTVKQRLREEVEFPFRSARLAFFGFSTVSALIASYFSLLNTLKAVIGGYSDALPLEECLQNDAINVGSVAVCAYLAFRDWNAGNANLNRIAKGGKLAQLVVEPAAAAAVDEDKTRSSTSSISRIPLADYRRKYRVLICAGGPSYIQQLALSLASDQLSDENNLPQQLVETDVMVVPVLLQMSNNNKATVVVSSDTANFWNNLSTMTTALTADGITPTGDAVGVMAGGNFDVSRAAAVINFPRGATAWQEYLASEVETAVGQGFDVLEKGVTLTIKKNGKILRRATGLPPWGEFISTMEVMDGSAFGMPGDSEKYGTTMKSDRTA